MSNASIHTYLCQDIKAFADAQSPAHPVIYPNIATQSTNIKYYPLRVNFLPIPEIMLGISTATQKTLIMQIDVLFPRNEGVIKVNEVIDKLKQRYAVPMNGIYFAGNATVEQLRILKPMETKPYKLEAESGVVINYVTFQYS